MVTVIRIAEETLNINYRDSGCYEITISGKQKAISDGAASRNEGILFWSKLPWYPRGKETGLQTKDYKQQQITESLQKPIATQGLIAGDYISLSGINAHKDSNTIFSVIFQTKDYNIERTILIIVKITCALSDFSRNNQFKWQWQLLDIKHTCCNLNWI